MRTFTYDCWGKLNDHNGTIGTSDKPAIHYAVEILNEQQRQIERLLSKNAELTESMINISNLIDNFKKR